MGWSLIYPSGPTVEPLLRPPQISRESGLHNGVVFDMPSWPHSGTPVEATSNIKGKGSSRYGGLWSEVHMHGNIENKFEEKGWTVIVLAS